MNNKNELLSGLLYEIAPESRYWASLVSDLEAIALSTLNPDRQFVADTALDCETSEEQRKVLHAILPHLQRVQSIHKKLSQVELQQEVAESLLDSMPTGIVVLNEAGRVYSMNKSAKTILRYSQLLDIVDKTLQVDGRPFNEILLEKMGESLISHSESFHFFLREKGEELSFLLSQARLSQYRLLFVSNEKGRENISREALKRLFSLSNSEAELCIHLVNGLSVDDIAQLRLTSVQTIRTQFKQIYRKTRCNGQVHLPIMGVLSLMASLTFCGIGPQN